MAFTLTPQHIHSLLVPCEKGDLSPLLAAIDQDVYWWIGGREDREAGTGVYNVQSWQTHIAGPLAACLKDGAFSIMTKSVDVIGFKAFVETEVVNATQKNGKPYDQKNFWIFTFDERGKIVRIKEYVDTLLLKETFTENKTV